MCLVWLRFYRFHTEIEESLKLVVPMMALMHLQSVNSNSINDTQMSYTHTALPAAMSASE